ncbi:hypothetical protein GCM10007071_11000 [Marinobacter zhanjiangensis]|uniref:Uncharacterized protein n=1 Tax=Marinobacter zhanjiangensis TaxID=578215 RepID=A0ABQ3AW35_9GAMM|nr:hypothetical protein GCM10007071_11000 [Marinobacter zhanjiangensis]
MAEKRLTSIEYRKHPEHVIPVRVTMSAGKHQGLLGEGNHLLLAFIPEFEPEGRQALS